ncbi:MAG: hypothetical protein L6R39_002991 [Caloplaca ligustica]|nr:MAG: hypothetical protein L6R39_002991 [Caloplaca ligustica]
MLKPSLAPVVYSLLFPNPKPTDPPNFQTYISKQLVPEVRAETARFYGHIDCVEAQYPGLDYAIAAHRLRLSRFPYHRRLFQALDQLRLTNHEIQTLCKWEGTRWARERYERDIGVRVRETTWDDVTLALSEPPTVTRTELRGVTSSAVTARHVPLQKLDQSVDVPDADIPIPAVYDRQHQRSGTGVDMEEEAAGGSSGVRADSVELEADESEDELHQSVGVELNQRLVAATEARSRGEEAVLDADWEQWLKEAAERGSIPSLALADAGQSMVGPSTTWTPQLPGAFESDSAPHSLPASFSLPPTANSTLDGTSVPPAGTAM